MRADLAKTGEKERGEKHVSPQPGKQNPAEFETTQNRRRTMRSASEEFMTNKPMFGTFGRYTEIPINDMTPEQKKGYDFVVRERGQAPGPYKIWLQNAPLMEIMVPMGVYLQGGHSQTRFSSGLRTITPIERHSSTLARL